MFSTQADSKNFLRRGRTAGVAATVGASAALIAIGFGGFAAANADTGSASRTASASSPSGLLTATPARAGLGPKNLLQKDDFYQTGLGPVSATVGTTGTQALSACSGEETMRDLTRGKASAYAEEIWTFDTNDTSLIESVAESSDNASAASSERKLNKLVRGCQHEPAGHWYYGKGHSLTVRGGTGTWYPSFSGDGEAAGGVAVIRSGHRFGIVELSGQPTDDPGYMQGIAAGSINRMAG